MKLLKKIIMLILLFGIIFNQNDLFANEKIFTNENLIVAGEKLSEIKKGKEYVLRINQIITKYGEDEELILKLQKRLNNVSDNLNKKEYKQKEELIKLIDYFSIKLYFAIEEIELKKQALEEELEETDKDNSEEDNNTGKEEKINKTVIYPGFSENFNNFEKNILAGNDYLIYSGKTSGLYESVDVGKLIFNISGSDVSDLKNSIESSVLYFEGLSLKTVSSSSIEIINSSLATLTFDNINDFIIPHKSEVSFRLEVKPRSIGYEKVGKTIKDIHVSSVKFRETVGVTSTQLTSYYKGSNTKGELFTITPGILEVTLTKDFSTSPMPEINIKALFGDNTKDSSSSAPVINIKKISFSYVDNSGIANFKLINSDNSADFVMGTKNGSILEFDLSSLESNNKTISEGRGENYKIYVIGTNAGITLELLKNGIIYDVEGVSGSDDLNINMENNINFGYRKF